LQVENVRVETSVQHVSGIQVLKVAGEIDVYTAPEFRIAVNKAIDAGSIDLIIDLTDVSYIDSSGFGALLGAVKVVKPKNGSINLAGCNEAIDRMLAITRLNTVFGIYPKAEDAANALKTQ
jgi:anti-sigma B factor antagonist